jgi:hypothetical protein
MTELKEEILTSHDMLLPRPRNDGAEGGDSHVARYAPPSPLTSLIFTSSSGTTAKHGVDHKKAHLKIIFSKNKSSLVKNLILP